MTTDYEFLTDPQRLSRLPRRPWHVYLRESSGSTSYYVQADDGDVVASFVDSDYDRPGAARAIAESLVLTKRAVEKHVNSIFSKLNLPETQDVSRRVKATLIFLSEDGFDGS